MLPLSNVSFNHRYSKFETSSIVMLLSLVLLTCCILRLLKTIVLVLSALIRIPYLLLSSSNFCNCFCNLLICFLQHINFSCEFQIGDVPSMNYNPCFAISCIPSIILSRYIINADGEIGSPCMLPTVTLNHSVVFPFTNTAAVASL